MHLGAILWYLLVWIVLVKWGSTVLGWIKNLLGYSQKSLSERYGSESWVLITGGSEGIGLALAKEFAKTGFNLILVARNPAQIARAKIEIQLGSPTTKLLLFARDFTHCHQTDFFSELSAQIADLDVSILVNNVGKFADEATLSVGNIQDLIKVNMCAQPGLVKLLHPKFSSRKSLSAIITISCATYSFPDASPIYKSTKEFNTFLAQLSPSSPDSAKIDYLLVEAGPTTTRMREFDSTSAGLLTPSDPKHLARRTLGSLGRTHKVAGTLLDELLCGLIHAIVALVPADARVRTTAFLVRILARIGK